MVVSPTGYGSLRGRLSLRTPSGGVAPQLSLTVGVPTVTAALHLPASLAVVRLAGQVMVGGSLSMTVTVKLQVLLLPWISVAMLLTVVVPTGKAKPPAGVLTRLWTAQLSVAVTAKVTLLVHWPGELSTVILAGQVMTGFSVSLTVTVWLQVAVLL